MPPPGSDGLCAFGLNAQKMILPGGVMTPPYNRNGAKRAAFTGRPTYSL